MGFLQHGRPLLTLLVILTACPAMVEAATCSPTPGRAGTIHLEVGEARRTFLLRLPSGHDWRTPAPVVFVFHAFSMDANRTAALIGVSVEWPEAIVVYPQGLPRQLGPTAGDLQPAWQRTAGDLEDRDLAFFDAMLAWLHSNQCVDETRVYAMGYSNGAMFSHLLACERAGAVAGLAVAAGRLPCRPLQVRPVIFSHGTRDSSIGYQQGIAAVQTWVQQNGCSAPPEIGTPGCSRAQACAGAPVVLCTHAGGHEYDAGFTREAVNFLKAQAGGKDAARGKE